MQTKILKVHYPSASADQIGELTAVIREQVLAMFKGNTMSYSFSYNKESGYIMVYPTAPILSIRVSNHETDGSVPVDSLIVESEDGRTMVVNAEVDGGKRVSEALVAEALSEAKQISNNIKNIIRDNE